MESVVLKTKAKSMNHEIKVTVTYIYFGFRHWVLNTKHHTHITHVPGIRQKSLNHKMDTTALCLIVSEKILSLFFFNCSFTGTTQGSFLPSLVAFSRSHLKRMLMPTRTDDGHHGITNDDIVTMWQTFLHVFI